MLLAACADTTTIVVSNPPPPTFPAPAVVQVENHPDSRPHSGLQRADIVFEYLTEGGITRFTALYFNPSGPHRIEPVRSARLIALRIRRSYQGVLFYSGASDYVAGKIYGQHLPAYQEDSAGGRFFARDGNRFAPHNLYTSEARLKDGVDRSHQRITYKLPAPAEPTGKGDPVSRMAFAQTPFQHVVYKYSAADRAYGYTSQMGPEIDVDNGGKQLMVTNVVLIYVPHHGMHYREDVLGEEGIDFDLQGTGPADVYTRGAHFKAKWDLTNPDKPFRILGGDGKTTMSLPAGLTWIHVVDPGTVVQTG